MPVCLTGRMSSFTCFNFTMNGVIAFTALVCIASGNVLKLDPSIEDEINEWRKRGLPEVGEFPSSGNGTVTVNFFEEPDEYSSGPIDGANIEKNIQYYMFTRENPSSGVPFSNNVEEVIAAGFNPKRPTKIIVHGFGCNIHTEIFKLTVPNLLKYSDYNVIGVDWGKLCRSPFYITARRRVPLVGAAIAGLVDLLAQSLGLKMQDLHAIGHSLGGHVVGNIGKNVKTGKMPRITGLDPAGPLFLLSSRDRLSPSDAEVVDVVHTCGGLAAYLGLLGKYDFYVNGGQRPQPGCGPDLFCYCSHNRAMALFAESILEPGSFKAAECSSVGQAERDGCSGATTANMGFHLRAPEPGPYGLKTASSAPFDIGYHKNGTSS